MLKGAIIFAIGTGAGLVVGMITGFAVSENIKKVSIGPLTSEGTSA